MVADWKRQTAEQQLDRLGAWIERADSKAGLLFGANVVMVAGISAFYNPGPGATAAGVAAAVLLALSFLLLWQVARPRLNAHAVSPLFFGDAAKMAPTDYAAQMSALDEPTLYQQLLGQCHELSIIANAKHSQLRQAFAATLLSVLPWALCILLSQVHG